MRDCCWESPPAAAAAEPEAAAAAAASYSCPARPAIIVAAAPRLTAYSADVRAARGGAARARCTSPEVLF